VRDHGLHRPAHTVRRRTAPDRTTGSHTPWYRDRQRGAGPIHDLAPRHGAELGVRTLWRSSPSAPSSRGARWLESRPWRGPRRLGAPGPFARRGCGGGTRPETRFSGREDCSRAVLRVSTTPRRESACAAPSTRSSRSTEAELVAWQVAQRQEVIEVRLDAANSSAARSRGLDALGVHSTFAAGARGDRGPPFRKPAAGVRQQSSNPGADVPQRRDRIVRGRRSLSCKQAA